VSVETVAQAHYRRQVTLARRTADRIATLWRQVDRGNLSGSWRALLPQAVSVLASAQGIAAASAGVYVDDALEAQGIIAAAAGRVNVAQLAGVASDGRNLAGLLYQPVPRAFTELKLGRTPGRAITAGLAELDMIVRTQVADAGRTADGVAIAARPTVTGYVRMLSAPSCSRCIALAGRHYRWNTGFQRHPRCDCRHIPASEDVAGALTTNPRAAFGAMDAAEQDRVFGKAGAQAIRDGADLSKVVNARRANRLYTAYDGQLFTHEAAGRRPRLMPEGIYAQAGNNRAEALRLLRLHGFLI
jgi:hypothetical protein